MIMCVNRAEVKNLFSSTCPRFLIQVSLVWQQHSTGQCPSHLWNHPNHPLFRTTGSPVPLLGYCPFLSQGDDHAPACKGSWLCLLAA